MELAKNEIIYSATFWFQEKRFDFAIILFIILYIPDVAKNQKGLVLDPPEFKNFTLTIIFKTMSFMLYICKQRAL